MKQGLVSYDPIDISQYEKSSAMIWATRNVRLPKGAPWDFEHRRWQVKIFDDLSPDLVVIKPTQIGMTTLMLCKMLHFATFNNVRVMYTLPRQDDVYDLVNGRLETMFRESPELSKRVGTVNNVRLKTFGRSFLHFMESSVAPRMLDVDCLVNDEVDLSNQDNLEQYKARLDASDYKIHWKISTPTVSNYGIDLLYQQSDKKTWLIKCPRCGTHQELSWESNVKHSNGETWYACGVCDKTFDPGTIQSGEWVAEFPSRPRSGYAVSQMMVTSINPNNLWADFKNMKAKNFYNLRLGKAHTPSTGAITKTLIYDKCLRETHGEEYTGQGYYLGADQGNDIHVAIGKMKDGELRIVHLEVIPMEKGFERLHTLMELYHIRKAVVDALPNRHSSDAFVKAYRGQRALVAFYTQADGTYKEIPNENRVDINRSTSFDYLYDRIVEGGLLLYGSKNNLGPTVRLAVSHLAAMRRDEVVSTTRIGGERTEIAWINSGQDHFAHAINYLHVAADAANSSHSFKIAQLGVREEKDTGEQTERYNNNPYAVARAFSRLSSKPNRIETRRIAR